MYALFLVLFMLFPILVVYWLIFPRSCLLGYPLSRLNIVSISLVTEIFLFVSAGLLLDLNNPIDNQPPTALICTAFLIMLILAIFSEKLRKQRQPNQLQQINPPFPNSYLIYQDDIPPPLLEFKQVKPDFGNFNESISLSNNFTQEKNIFWITYQQEDGEISKYHIQVLNVNISQQDWYWYIDAINLNNNIQTTYRVDKIKTITDAQHEEVFTKFADILYILRKLEAC